MASVPPVASVLPTPSHCSCPYPCQVCWLIGTITSATDPVAVVALLKELGTEKAIGTLIEGESLLNDGSAVVLYVALLTNCVDPLPNSLPLATRHARRQP